MKITSIKHFGTVIGGVSRSAKSQRDNIQGLIEFGFAHYVEHGQTEYLNRIVDCATKSHTISTPQLKKYIKAHTNLKFGALKNGKEGFSVGNKKADKFNAPSTLWYEYEKAIKAPSASDTLKQAEGFIKRIESSLDSDLGVMDKSESFAILKGLRSIVAELSQGELKDLAA